MIGYENRDHILKLITASMRNLRPGLTRREIRKNRLKGSLGVIQGLLADGLIIKADSGKYIINNYVNMKNYEFTQKIKR